MADGAAVFGQGFTGPALLTSHMVGPRKGLSPAMAVLPSTFRSLHMCFGARPLSLATTRGISLDLFSYGYLDVSVPRVRALAHGLHPCRFPDSDIHGYSACLRLPMAFRSLPRPSSPLTA